MLDSLTIHVHDSALLDPKEYADTQALEKALKYLGLYERENTQHSENLELQVVLVGKP